MDNQNTGQVCVVFKWLIISIPGSVVWYSDYHLYWKWDQENILTTLYPLSAWLPSIQMVNVVRKFFELSLKPYYIFEAVVSRHSRVLFYSFFFIFCTHDKFSYRIWFKMVYFNYGKDIHPNQSTFILILHPNLVLHSS